MRVILLAAGFGTRLRPLTNNLPKCLIPIKGRPLLEIWVEKLVKEGYGPFLINTHYLEGKVLEFIEANKYREKIKQVHEEKLLGTAGTLIKNIDFYQDKDGMLIHADNYCLEDLRNLKKAHNNRPKNCLMTMMTFQTDNPSSCGIVEVNNQNIVINFHEKKMKPPGNLANCAIYILSSQMIHEIKKETREASDFSTEIIERYIGRIYNYQTKKTYIDVGTPEAYNKIK